MRNCIVYGVIAFFCIAGLSLRAKETLLPVKFSDVKIEDNFWTRRLKINRTVSIPHNLDTCESTGRIRNFAQAAGVDKTPFRGHYFHDSDVFKVLEGAAYSLANHPDEKLEARLDHIIDLIARSQQPDGYLNTWFTLKEPDKRWADIRVKHELYCAGHMFEAAVAHYHATGKRTFLDVACRYADYIDSVFGPDKRHVVPGHEEIELALVKLWRATGNDRYLKLSRFFVYEHGGKETHDLFGKYCQDHLPISEQTEPVGHAVRWLYLYSAVADHAAMTGDRGHIDAMERLWRNIVEKKMYITGGVGVQNHGEGFAEEYFLPNERAYCETCASIGMAFWNHRLALLHGEGRFADLVERVLYNGALSGVSLSGDKYFYVNPLESAGGHHRQAWYGCACCPTNVVRFVASLAGYIYGTMKSGPGIYILQYIGNTTTLEIGGHKVTLAQKTRYPWEGSVRITVSPDRPSEFAVGVRIPAWCTGASVVVNGEAMDNKPHDGFVVLRRRWEKGDTVGLTFPMPVRQVAAHPEVKANIGRRAVMRGPVVYCFEDCDNPCAVNTMAIPENARFTTVFEPELLGGVVTVGTEGTTQAVVETDDGKMDVVKQPVRLKAVPYYSWDNRDAGRMIVWVPTESPALSRLENATKAVVAGPSASHCCPRDTVAALNDNSIPESSSDHSIPRFTWWDRRGTKEWISYTFKQPKTFSSVEVYWFDDTGNGSCRVPESWRLLYHDGTAWKPVAAENEYTTEKDTYNTVKFTPVKTRRLRIEVQLRQGMSGGVLEWRTL